MKKICLLILQFTITCSLLYSQNLKSNLQASNKSIVLIVDTAIYDGIKKELLVLISDLEFEEYNVILKVSSYDSPENVRGYLQDIYATTIPKLYGTILFGDIPLARQYFLMTHTNPDLSPTNHNGLSTQFYSDLDGTFIKNNANYPDSYSEHNGEVFSEIWVSVLPFYKNIETTIAKINEYLKKNHIYRTGGYSVENGYLEINEHYVANNLNDYNNYIQWMTSGQYSWHPFTEWGNVGLYIKNSINKPDVYYAYDNELDNNKYLFSSLITHGSVRSNGLLSIEDVRSMNITPIFVWLGGCQTGNLDYDENIATEFAYSNRSNALVVKGGTANVGGLGTNEDGFYGKNYATDLLAGKSFGQAFIEHNNVPLIYPWNLNYEMNNAVNVFIGDLSLTLFPLLKPQKVSILSPLNMDSIFTYPINFSWLSSKNSEKYHLQIAQNNKFESIVFNDTTIVDTVYNLSSLTCAGNYYCRIQGINSSYHGEWSETLQFNLTSIPNSDILSGTIANKDDVICKNDLTGSIMVRANGGIVPYNFSIDAENFQDSSFFVNLTTGNYTIFIVDENNCKVELTCEIQSIDTVSPILSCPPNITVNGNNNIPDILTTLDQFISAGGSCFDNCEIDITSFSLKSELIDTTLLPDVMNRLYSIRDNNLNENKCIQKITIVNANDLLMLNKNEESKFQIFPNPSNGKIMLIIKDSQNEKIEIMFLNSQGQKIIWKDIILTQQSQIEIFDLSLFSKGIYFVIISDAKISKSIKIILQ